MKEYKLIPIWNGLPESTVAINTVDSFKQTIMSISYDSVYEDIYDFDEINGKSDDPKRSGKTYTFDEYGHIVRPTYRPRITDDRVRLPPVLIGNTRASPTPTNRSGINSLPEKSSAKLWKQELDRHKERQPLHESVTSKSHWANTDLDKQTRTQPRPFRPEPLNHEEIYRSLMEGLHDTSTLEKSPQVLEYERRNRIKQQANLSQVTSENHGSSQYHSAGDVFMKRVKVCEESIKSGSRIGHERDHVVLKPVQESVFQPAPPTAPKPEGDNSSYNRSIRRLLHTNQLEQDVSVHKPSAPYHKPRTPVTEVVIDYDLEVQEALRVQKELDLLHQEFENMNIAKKAEMVHGMEMIRPTTAAAANSNLPGCSTPCLIPAAAVPYKSAEPVKPWNGDAAKRGLGFRSRIRREQQEQQEIRKLDINHLPDKIRKEMKKYFG